MVLTPMSPFVTNTPTTHEEHTLALRIGTMWKHWGNSRKIRRKKMRRKWEQNNKTLRERSPNQRPQPPSVLMWWLSHSSSDWDGTQRQWWWWWWWCCWCNNFYTNAWLPKKAVTSSGAELPAAMNVAPATSWDNPRPERETPRKHDC